MAFLPFIGAALVASAPAAGAGAGTAAAAGTAATAASAAGALAAGGVAGGVGGAGLALGSAASLGAAATGIAAPAAGMTAAQALGLAATTASVAGAGVSGVAGANQARFQAALARHNAVAAKRQAAVDEDRLRRDSRRQLGSARAAFGAAGVTMQGTPLDLMAEQAMESEFDALMVRYGGRAASGEQRARSRQFGAAATGELVNAGFQGGSTALTGAYRFNRGGGYPTLN